MAKVACLAQSESGCQAVGEAGDWHAGAEGAEARHRGGYRGRMGDGAGDAGASEGRVWIGRDDSIKVWDMRGRSPTAFWPYSV